MSNWHKKGGYIHPENGRKGYSGLGVREYIGNRVCGRSLPKHDPDMSTVPLFVHEWALVSDKVKFLLCNS